MTKKLIHGSYHCGNIKFKAIVDLAQTTTKCNCTFCYKNSYWSIKSNIEDFKLLAGEEFITQYTKYPEIGYYAFCKNCGSMLYGKTKKSEWTENEYRIKISSIDDLTTEEKSSLQIFYANGVDDSFSEITDPEIIKTMY